MKAIRTPLSDGVETGPAGKHMDPLPVFHKTGKHGPAIYSVWEPSPDERDAIAQGANLLMGVFSMVSPPVGLGVVAGVEFESMDARPLEGAHIPVAVVDMRPMARLRRWWNERTRRSIGERVIPFQPAHGEKPNLPALDRRRE